MRAFQPSPCRCAPRYWLTVTDFKRSGALTNEPLADRPPMESPQKWSFSIPARREGRGRPARVIRSCRTLRDGRSGRGRACRSAGCEISCESGWSCGCHMARWCRAIRKNDDAGAGGALQMVVETRSVHVDVGHGAFRLSFARLMRQRVRRRALGNHRIGRTVEILRVEDACRCRRQRRFQHLRIFQQHLAQEIGSDSTRHARELRAIFARLRGLRAS